MAYAKTDKALDSQVNGIALGNAAQIHPYPCLAVFDGLRILVKNHIPEIHPGQAGSKFLLRRFFAGPEIVQVAHRAKGDVESAITEIRYLTRLFKHLEQTVTDGDGAAGRVLVEPGNLRVFPVTAHLLIDLMENRHYLCPGLLYPLPRTPAQQASSWRYRRTGTSRRWPTVKRWQAPLSPRETGESILVRISNA